MILSSTVQKANVGFVCEELMCSLGIDRPGAVRAAGRGAIGHAHAAQVDGPVSGGVDPHVGLLSFMPLCKPLGRKCRLAPRSRPAPLCTSLPARAAANLVSIFFQ